MAIVHLGEGPRGPERSEKREKKGKKGKNKSVAVIHESFEPLTAFIVSLGRESPLLTGLNST